MQTRRNSWINVTEEDLKDSTTPGQCFRKACMRTFNFGHLFPAKYACFYSPTLKEAEIGIYYRGRGVREINKWFQCIKKDMDNGGDGIVIYLPPVGRYMVRIANLKAEREMNE